MELTLDCKTRSPEAKPKAMRRDGKIPAVMYGHEGTESISLEVDAKDADTLLRKATVNNTLIQLAISDINWKGRVVLRDAHLHPWKNNVLYHLSFFAVGADEYLDVNVPINLVGEAPGLKTGGGSLEQVMNELHLRCKPANIPDSIDVSIAHLDVGGSVHLHEITLPEGTELNDDPERIIATVLAPRTTTVEEEPTTAETVLPETEETPVS